MGEGNNHIKTYTAEDIQSYLEGRMNSSEMNALERAALEDPFLSDAIEGYKASGANVLSSRVELKQALNDRLKDSPRRISFPLWLRIAAAIGILAVSIIAITLVMNPGMKHDETLASKQKPVVQTDSLTTFAKPDSAIIAYQEPSKNVKALSPKKSRVLKSKEPPPEAKENSLSPALDKNVAKDISDHLIKTEEVAPKPAASELERSARGIVIDTNKKPIVGAIVKMEKQQVLTDNAGLFELKPTDTVMNIEVQSVGFATQNVLVNNDGIRDTIVLRPSDKALGEVVVAGYGVNKPAGRAGKKQVTNEPVASPSISWEKYNAYIVGKLDSSGLNTALNTEVVISFLVDVHGKLSMFKVEKPAPTEMMNNFLIDLIKTGPSWQVQGGIPARGMVRIKPEREN